MKKFYSGIVKHRKLIIVLFAVLSIACMILQNLVEVNYDMNDYLPEDCKSTISIDVMEDEFDGGIPNARVMVYDVTVPQALEYKDKIEKVSGVTDVMWLDDATDITVPLSSIDVDTVETYYKDNNALFTVTIEENSRISAVSEIRKIVGDDNAMTGSAVSTALSTTNTVSEIGKITVIAVIFVLIVLIITTNSWLEPILLFFSVLELQLYSTMVQMLFSAKSRSSQTPQAVFFSLPYRLTTLFSLFTGLKNAER